MITEDFISFETAKLLKKKGFDEKCRTYYKVFPEERIAAIYHSSENRGVSKDDPNEILCPTLQMAMKWLREVHKLHIEFALNQDVQDENAVIENYYHFNVSRLDRFVNEGGDCKFYKFYEEACEASIKHCLENLI